MKFMEMNSYKTTAEYAYDVIQHFYEPLEAIIYDIGKENLVLYIPIEIYELLAKHNLKYVDRLKYPATFRGIEIIPYKESKVIFALKNKRGGVEDGGTSQ